MTCTTLEHIREVTDRNVLTLQDAKAAGKKVVGLYCIYSPDEIPMAAGAIPVSLCGTKNDSIPAAESILPRSLCPLIKSSFGFVLQDSCPYLAASDLVVADTTCDGKKKMYELLAEYKPLMMLQLPQIQNEAAESYWRDQFAALVARIEQDFGTVIDENALRTAIHVNNGYRMALKRVLDAAKRKPSPLSGMEILEIPFRISFMSDREEATRLLNALADELEHGAPSLQPADAPRLLLTGVPMGMGSHKVVQLLGECGASVVCIDNCSSYKKTRQITDETGDPLTALAKKYLETPCAVMSPNPGRAVTLRELTEEFSIDAVVDVTWQGCQTYDVESSSIKKFVKEELKLPFLQIVTDYSQTDTEQLKVRMEAFLEMLR